MKLNPLMPKRFKRKITKEQIDKFANLSKDTNPIHIDELFASKTRFGSVIAHGALLIAHLLGESNSKISKLEIIYSLPTFPNDELEFSIEENEGKFNFEIKNQNNEKVAEGNFDA